MYLEVFFSKTRDSSKSRFVVRLTGGVRSDTQSECIEDLMYYPCSSKNRGTQWTPTFLYLEYFVHGLTDPSLLTKR